MKSLNNAGVRLQKTVWKSAKNDYFIEFLAKIIDWLSICGVIITSIRYR